MTTQATKNKTQLGILLCGRSPDNIVEQFGQYNLRFEDLLGHEAFEYTTYAVVDGEFPSSIEDADAWLVTGSKHGAYDPLPWIPPLEDFIREAFGAKKPMVGVCFGHQILSQALGGKVEKFKGGWKAGTTEYTMDADFGVDSLVLNAWHQDQVVEIPENARTIGTSDHCENAIIAYADHAISMQPHPEFGNEYLKVMLKEVGPQLPKDVFDDAAASVGQEISNKQVAKWFTEVLSQAS